MALRVVYYEASHDHASRRNSPEFHQLYPLARRGSRWEVNQARFPIIAGQRKDTRRLPTQLPGLLACGDPDAPSWQQQASSSNTAWDRPMADRRPQQVILLHSLSVFVVAVQPVLLEELLQRPEHPQPARSHALQHFTRTALFALGQQQAAADHQRLAPNNSGPMRPSIVGTDGDVHRLEGDAGAEPLSTCFAPATQPIAERLGTISPEPRRGNQTSMSSNTHASPYVLFRAPHIPSLQNRTPRYLSALSACPFPMTMRSYTPASI